MSQYAAAHVNPQGPGDARPTALQIVQDNQMNGKLAGKVAVVTGVSSGLGIETTRALAATGATLYLTARDLSKAKDALKDIFQPDQMKLVHMDQSSLESVREAAKTILSTTDKISILINNAGIMAVPDLQFTKDCYESQFGTNHLSHFLFFTLLKPALLAGSTPEFQSRVVMLSSAGHRSHGINSSTNYNFENGNYDPWISYAQSKTANIYMANEIERRYGAKGIHGLSVHPGIVATGVGRFLPEEVIQGMLSNEAVMAYLKSGEQGAATTVLAAVGKGWEGKGGRYLAECAEAERGIDDGDAYGTGYVSHTYDVESESRLWRDSLGMVGLTDE